FLGRSASQWTADLASRDASVRRSATFALSQLGERAVAGVPALVRLLGDPDPGVREGAAFALGQIRQGLWAEAVVALCNVLARDQAAPARQSAASALGNIAEAILSAEDQLAATVR